MKKRKRNRPERRKSSSSPQRAGMEEVLQVIESTCEAKGWQPNLESLDRQSWRYATISVKRATHSGTVTGILEITVADGVQVHAEKTSFYGHGFSDLYEAVTIELGRLPWLVSKDKSSQAPQAPTAPLEQLNAMLLNFHTVAHQLTQRQRGRPPFLIQDEYDVQDLLHALLRVTFDDVRAEEVVPSYAGSSSRLDFLIKGEGIVIEAKMASEKLRDKQLGEQLIIDIKRYQAHPDCRTLVCLVYDPFKVLKNPAGIRNDLSGKHENLNVRVIIVPA